VVVSAKKQWKEGEGERRQFRECEASGGGRHTERGCRGECCGKGRRKGKEERLEGEGRSVGGGQLLAGMVAGYAGEKVCTLVKFPRSITPGTGREPKG